MQRLNSVNPQVAQGRTKELLDTVQQSLQRHPQFASVAPDIKSLHRGIVAEQGDYDVAALGNRLLPHNHYVAIRHSRADHAVA